MMNTHGAGREQDARSSIRLKLFRLVVAVAAIALIISLTGAVLFAWNHQERQVRQSLSTIAHAAGVAASAAVAFHDRKAAGEALRIMVARHEVETAVLYPLDGQPLAIYGSNAGVPQRVDQLLEHLPGFSLFASATTLFQPIRLDDAVIGYIFIRASLQDARRSFLQHAGLAIGLNLAGLVLVLSFGQRFLDRIVTPVRELADTTRQVREERDFSLRATPPATDAPRDEIGELVANFNAMLTEIEVRDRELALYHRELESMVEERTSALHATNRELQIAKENAESASLSKSRFLAAASHDLRQPIQAINLFRDALTKTPLNAMQQRIIDNLSQATQSLGELLNALLDVSKLDAGATLPCPETVGVHALFSRIEAEFASLAADKSLRFKLWFPLEDMALHTDAKMLESLMRNLIGNAIKYTERGGLLVAARRRGQQVLIQIWDTGIGIAPEHMETIFDEYFQIGNPERDKAKGLGLGLAIAKRLAKFLNTTVVCRSCHGRGSVFQFQLPLAA